MMRGYVTKLRLACQAVASAKAGAPALNRNRQAIVVILFGDTHTCRVGRVTPVRAIVERANDSAPYLRRVYCGRRRGGCINRLRILDWGAHPARVLVIASSRSRTFEPWN